MKEKIKKIDFVTFIFGLFGILFLFFPIRYGLFNVKYSILILILIISIIIALKKLNLNIKMNEKHFLKILLFLAIITRIGIVFLLNNKITQISDFGSAFVNSENLTFANETYRVFTHWILYPVILNKIYKIFGYSQLVALLTNAVILILVSILIYKIALIIFKDKKYAFYSSLIYILWPANILYTLILTQEHLCALLLLAALYLFLKLEKNDFNYKNKYKQILSIIIMAFCFSLSSFLKNFSPVFFLAFIIYFIITFLQKKNYLVKSKSFLSRFLFLLILYVSFSIFNNIIYLKIDDIIGVRVTRNIIPCYLNVGFRDEGVYNSNNYGMYFEKMRLYDYDEKKANQEIISDLLDYWKSGENKYSLLTLLNLKAKIIFGGDKRIGWVNSSLEKEGNVETINFLANYISKINNVYFLALVILMVFGIFNLIKEKKLFIFLCYLIIFGGLLLLLLVEAQNRYMYTLQTIICILSVYGYVGLKKQIDKLV